MGDSETSFVAGSQSVDATDVTSDLSTFFLIGIALVVAVFLLKAKTGTYKFF
jgi:hypothetical protein